MQRELKSPVTPEEISNGELYGVLLKAKGEAQPLNADVLRQKLAVAEDYLERELQLRWKPTRVFSDVFARLRAVNPNSTLKLYPKSTEHPAGFDKLADIAEPAYDYSNDFWAEDRWGWLGLNFRPILDVASFVFAFPGAMPVWQPPLTWLRLDEKFGTVQLVPSTAEAIYVSFNAFLLGTLAGGRGLPQSIYVDYTVGFADGELRANNEDLLELLRLIATLEVFGIAQTSISPGGAGNTSLGLDGLSRSVGFGGKWGPYSGRIELALNRIEVLMDSWKRRERGIPMVVC